MKITILTILLFTISCTVINTKDCCNLKSVSDIERVNIKSKAFKRIDSVGRFLNYNVHYECDNGLSIRGNIDERGKKNGLWAFDRQYAAGYVGVIHGNFKNNKMEGYWHLGNDSVFYLKGKRVTQ